MNKWPVIENEIYLNMSDIVCISERWILDAKDCDSFDIDDYVTFADCRVVRRGGDTLMLVKAEFQPALAHQYYNCRHQCNVTGIYIGVAKLKTIVCCAYRHPDTTEAESDTFIEHLETLTASATSLIIVGDFNYLNIDWFKPIHSAHEGINDAFQNAYDYMGLTQYVTSATHGDYILDLVLLSHPEQLIDYSSRPPIATSDHLFVLFNIQPQQN